MNGRANQESKANPMRHELVIRDGILMDLRDSRFHARWLYATR